MFNFEVKGVEELKKMLREYRGVKAPNAIKKGSRAGCKIIANVVKGIIPSTIRRDRQGEYSIGNLRRAIKVKTIRKSKNGMVGAMVTIGESDVKADPFYGAFVEFGTKKMRGRRYLQQAAKEGGPSATRVAIEIIAKELNKG